MPRTLVDNPSKDTLRKRAQRANEQSKDIKQKNAEYMRLYRAKLREQKKKNEPPQEHKSDPAKTLNDI